MSQALHKAWVKVAAVVVMAIAPLFLLATLNITDPARLMVDVLAWPPDGKQNFDGAEIRFLSALAGGFLLGWGITLWMLAHWVYDHAPNQVRRATLIGALAWFAWDGVGSAFAGVPSNIAFNTVFLLVAVGPLWWPARSLPDHHG